MSLPEVFQFSVPPSLLSDTTTEPEESTYQEELLLATPQLIEDEVFKLDLDETLIEDENKDLKLISWQPDEGEFANAAQHNYRLWLAGGN